MQEYINAWADYLKKTWGLSSSFAKSAATLIIYLHYYGLNPRITSGWRSQEKQDQLSAQYQRGEYAGLRAKPAAKSKHTISTFLGHPAAEAIDIVTNNDQYAGSIAEYLGIGSGLRFNDPGHFYQL